YTNPTLLSRPPPTIGSHPFPMRRRAMGNLTSKIVTGAAVGAAVVGGAAIANAATSSTGSPSTSTAPAATQTNPRSNMPAPGSPSHEGAEKVVTGSAAAKEQAAS